MRVSRRDFRDLALGPEARRGDMVDQANVMGGAGDLEVRVRLAQASSVQSAEYAIQEERGHVGICVDCGDPIAEARMKAIPKAVRCVGCQEAKESQKN